jgi:ubiquitin carboxyl-terminal hydrolase 8
MVGRFKSEFAGRDQQDSHEFCSKLLEWLHGDTNRVVRPSKEPEQNFRDSRDTSAAATHWRNYLERNQSIIVQLFCGQTRSVLRCLSCGGESVTYREFTNLTLPLPETSNKISLQECFEDYLREEVIDEVTCDSCKKMGRATKKTEIVKLPPLLVIHLSRFYQDGMYTRKKQNFVNFELKSLNIGKYAMDGFDNKWSVFSLYAVSNHFGSLEGGHYTAYCSSSVLKKWHKYDDQDVSSMDSSNVVTPAAYILFYSAIEGVTSLPPLC